MLPRCRSLIPGRINTHSFTDDEMMVLEAMDLEAYRIIHGKLHQHHWGKEGEDHGSCGCGRWSFVPGDVLVVVAERQADLPLDNGIHEQPQDSENGKGRNPLGFLQ